MPGGRGARARHGGLADGRKNAQSERAQEMRSRPRATRARVQPTEDDMAKGQMRSNKEKKKPKAEWNKKKKGSAAPSPYAAAQAQTKPGFNPFGKK
jgi:hypothetical protein